MLAASAAGGGYAAYVATRPLVFRHGVASGDPTARSVLLWTRVTVDDAEPIEVDWVISTDERVNSILATGKVTTNSDKDGTARVDVTDLQPGTTYHYRFAARGQKSKVGRTKTLPEGPVSSFKIAFLCCSSYGHGAFHPYAKLAELRDIDLVVHLGDYIYEFASGEYGNARRYDPLHTCVSLDDYRRRHRQYKADRSLAEAHRLFPWITLWDDHDFANNAFPGGAEGHKVDVHGDWPLRRDAARQAFLEYLPIRAETTGPLSRSVQLGDLADLIVLDSRMGAKTEPGKKRSRETMLGNDQEDWLAEALRGSKGQFCVLAQQLIISTLNVGERPYDQVWQAYPRSRSRLLSQVQRFARARTLCVSGDVHAAAAGIVRTSATESSNSPPAMVEFVTPGVTSPCPFVELTTELNPHLAYLNTTQRGFLLLELTPKRAIATFHHVDPPAAKGEQPVWSVGKQFGVTPGVVALDEITG